MRGSPGVLSHARTVRAAPHGGTMRAVACKWGRSRGKERGSIARGGLSGDMEGYQIEMISGPVDCGVTSAWAVVMRPPRRRVCALCADRCVECCHALYILVCEPSCRLDPCAPPVCAAPKKIKHATAVNCVPRVSACQTLKLKSSGAHGGSTGALPTAHHCTRGHAWNRVHALSEFTEHRVLRATRATRHTSTSGRGAPGPPAARAGEPSQGSFSSP